MIDCEFVSLSPADELLLQNFGGGQRLYLLRVFFPSSSCNQISFLWLVRFCIFCSYGISIWNLLWIKQDLFFFFFIKSKNIYWTKKDLRNINLALSGRGASWYWFQVFEVNHNENTAEEQFCNAKVNKLICQWIYSVSILTTALKFIVNPIASPNPASVYCSKNLRALQSTWGNDGIGFVGGCEDVFKLKMMVYF